MSVFIKNAMKLSLLKSASTALRPSAANKSRQFVRNVWHMSPPGSQILHQTRHKFYPVCGIKTEHSAGGNLRAKAAITKLLDISPGERDLAEFLNEEIAAEKATKDKESVPNEIEGFKAVFDNSEVTLVKQIGNETVEVNFTVNHSVDAEQEDLESKPVFDVKIKRDGKSLVFTCSIISDEEVKNRNEKSQAANKERLIEDLFVIDEITIYDGEWKDSYYSVSGEIIDDTLYDLLMNLLEEKGLTETFIHELIDLSTIYEHKCYVNMLEKVQKFVSRK